MLAMSKPTENSNVTSSSTLDLETSLVNLTKRMNLGRVDYLNAMVLHCGVCNTIWGDSSEVCGEVKQLNCIICLRVTKDVVVQDELEFRLDGKMAGSFYKALHCSGCQCFVGVVPYSTPKNISALRNLFLLQKENINCYTLRTGTMVKASSLHFDQSSVDKSIKELNQEWKFLDERFTASKRLKAEDNVIEC